MGREKMAPFGRDEHGEVLYWPDESRLSVRIPVPLEQHLERFGAILGMDAEEAAIHLLRNALIDRAKLLHEGGWMPDRKRYLKSRKGRR